MKMSIKRLVFGVMALVMLVSVLMQLKVVEPNYYFIAASFLFAAVVFVWPWADNKKADLPES